MGIGTRIGTASNGGSAGVAGVTSFAGRTGVVVPVAGDYGPTLGGTGQTGVATGDLLYGSNTNVWSRRGIGAAGQLLAVVSGVPNWTSTWPIPENGGQVLNAALSADGKYTGDVIDGTAGAALAFGDVIYLAAADSRWELTDADAVGTAGNVLVGMCVLAAAADGDPTKILLRGTIRADAKFPTFTISGPVFISTVPGEVVQTQPSGTDDVVRVLGHAIDANTMYLNPSPDWITVT